MDLKTFYLSMSADRRQQFAINCGTTPSHLRNVAYGKRCGESLAINIERESDGSVRCEDLRPDVDWAYLRGTQPTACPAAVANCESCPEPCDRRLGIEPNELVERKRSDDCSGAIAAGLADIERQRAELLRSAAGLKRVA